MESPSGTNHFASSPSRCNGEVQIARWSRKIFLKNLRSSDGVGDGEGCGGGGVFAGIACADAAPTITMISARNTAQRRKQSTTIIVILISTSLSTPPLSSLWERSAVSIGRFMAGLSSVVAQRVL